MKSLSGNIFIKLSVGAYLFKCISWIWSYHYFLLIFNCSYLHPRDCMKNCVFPQINYIVLTKSPFQVDPICVWVFLKWNEIFSRNILFRGNLPLPGRANREVRLAEYISVIIYVTEMESTIMKNLAFWLELISRPAEDQFINNTDILFFWLTLFK